MHTAKKRRRITEKEKGPLSDKFLVASTLAPPRQHHKSNISKNNASKKGIVHKHRRRPIIDLRFSPWRKVCAHKIMPSTRQLRGTTN
jgi:hypothetical protein